MTKITKKETKLLLDFYTTIKELLDCGMKQECYHFIQHQLYASGDSSNGTSDIFKSLDRFVKSLSEVIGEYKKDQTKKFVDKKMLSPLEQMNE